VLIFAVAFMVLLGGWLVAFGATVYHGWLFASLPWVTQTRRRLYWWFMAPRASMAWALPGAFPFGLSVLALALGTWLITQDSKDPLGIAAAAGGFVGMWTSILLAWLRPSWFLARWHRAELERERAGQDPLIPPPDAGRTMTMTRREQVIGYLLVGLLVVAWWIGLLPPAVLIGAATVLGILAVAETRRR